MLLSLNQDIEVIMLFTLPYFLTEGMHFVEHVQDYEYIMNKDGMPKCLCPHHWKGENGIYCAGFSRQGLAGIARDAMAIANDIGEVLNGTKEKIKIN